MNYRALFVGFALVGAGFYLATETAFDGMGSPLHALWMAGAFVVARAAL